MHKHKQVKRVSAVALALLSAGFLTTPRQAMAADVPDSAQVSQLLSEAKAQAFQLKEDAATLQSFTGSNLGWQSHAAVVNQMKEHVNAWATSLPSWKKTAN